MYSSRALFPLEQRWFWILYLGIALGMWAQLAELVSRAIKRWAGQKNSGRLLPELGGALDLTDNFVRAALLMYLFMWVVATAQY